VAGEVVRCGVSHSGSVMESTERANMRK
jgi:hypothetical protein